MTPSPTERDQIAQPSLFSSKGSNYLSARIRVRFFCKAVWRSQGFANVWALKVTWHAESIFNEMGRKGCRIVSCGFLPLRPLPPLWCLDPSRPNEHTTRINAANNHHQQQQWRRRSQQEQQQQEEEQQPPTPSPPPTTRTKTKTVMRSNIRTTTINIMNHDSY